MILSDTIQRLHSEFRVRRADRWRGDCSSVPLSAFSSSDRAAVETLYEKLQALQTDFEEVGYESEEARRIFDTIVSQRQWRVLLELARSINDDAQGEIDQKLLLQVRHDIRGGALTQLLNLFQFAARGILEDNEFAQSYLRVRDHTKIMRNAIPELDRERYDRDSGERIHNVELLLEKWSNPRLFAVEQIVETRVHCDFFGPVSDRCVEFAALDRVVYNLMNNATQRTANGRVDLHITAGAQENPSTLLIAVVNEVEEHQAATLREEFGSSDLSCLMSGGFTTDGHGIGLRICADFVAFAFGVTCEEAIDDGYVGAKLTNQHFVSWVHWPIVEGQG